MSSSSITSSTPNVVMLGIQDLSTTAPSVQPEQIPTHLPKVYLYAQKGPTVPQLVVGAGLPQTYGTDTFDLRKKFTTHQTVMANLVNSKGNAQMIERLLPTDMGPKANFLLSLDVLSTTVPQYQRNTDGTYVTNNITGLPVPVSPAATVPGYICKWVITNKTTGGPSVADSTTFGNSTVTAGSMPSGTPTSQLYPILEFWASSYGAYGNDAGFRISAPNVNTSPALNAQLLSTIKAYPFRLQAISRVNSTSTPTVSPLLNGDQSFDFVLQPGMIDPNTDAQVSLGDVFPTAYQAIDVPNYQDVFADIGNLHIYQTNINTLMAEFYAAEQTYTSAGSDFTSGATDEQWKFNLVSGQSSTGAPYYSFVLNTSDSNAVALTPNTNLFAAGGSDGTMSETLFADLVTTAVSEYGNANSPLLDTAVNVESIMYDTGFPLATKQAMCNFISQRKDTFVVLSTYDVNGSSLTETQEAALGIALRTQLQLFPESSYFGTPVVRGLVMGRYGTLIGSQYKKQLPLTLELASKSAAFMGASSGNWNKTYLFDNASKQNGSEVTLFSNVNVTFTPANQRNTDWANGLNYPISFSRGSLFFPALKTAYSDDTSVLTSYFMAMACVQLEKVGIQAWRNFSGSIDMTPSQLVSAVNQFITDKTNGVFAGLFKIIPAAYISDGDAQRGYSWQTPIQIYGNVPDTVQTLSLQAYRMSSLPTGS